MSASSSSSSSSTAGAVPVSTRESDSKAEYAFSLQCGKNYLVPKVALCTATGAIVGSSAGYYIGDAMALYGYTYAFGFGVFSTAYFSGTYTLRYFRNTDDYMNHALSGFVNGGWMTMAFGGPRRAILGSVGGALVGVTYKLVGDFAYTNAREAWLRVRVNALNSPTRVLHVKKPQFPPKNPSVGGNVERSSTERESGVFTPETEGRHVVMEKKPIPTDAALHSSSPTFWWSRSTTPSTSNVEKKPKS